MTNAIEAIAAKLAEVFAPLDEQVKLDARAWGVARMKAVAEFKRSDEGRAMVRDQAAYYARVFALAGGKTWHNRLEGRNEAMIFDVMDKNTAALVKARNASIAVKMRRAGVTEVVSSEFSTTRDGFDGRFHVNTDKGPQWVVVNTIRAGGYNIQCAHLRVLVSVKPIKPAKVAA